MEEQLIHVDADDRVLGPVARSKAHREGLLHRAGCVILAKRDGRVFVAKRSTGKSIFPGCHDWPCSFHVAHGESYDGAAQRELLEETAIRAIPSPLGTIVIDAPPDPMVVAVYELVHEGPIVLDPDEATGGRFYRPADIAGLIEAGPATSWFSPAWALRVASRR